MILVSVNMILVYWTWSTAFFSNFCYYLIVFCVCFFWLLIGNKWIFGEEKRVEREVGKDPSDVDIEKDVSEDHQMDKVNEKEAHITSMIYVWNPSSGRR